MHVDGRRCVLSPGGRRSPLLSRTGACNGTARRTTGAGVHHNKEGRGAHPRLAGAAVPSLLCKGNGGSGLAIALLLLGLALVSGGFVWLHRKAEAAEDALPLPIVADTGTEGAHPLEILSRPVPHARPVRGTIAGSLLGSGVTLLIMGVILVFQPKPRPPVPDKTDLIRMAREQYGLVLVDADKAPSPTVKVLAPDTPPPTIVVRVVPGDLPGLVADKLVSAKVIADKNAFLQRLTERHLDTNLKVGDFSLPVGATVDKVIDALTA